MSSIQFMVEKDILQKSTEREFDRFEKLGIVRGHNNEEYGQMRDDQITERLKVLGEIGNHSGDTPGK